jgi:hypothetical protein
MPIPDSEELLRFVGFNDYDAQPGSTPRVRTSLFRLSYEPSLNRSSIWSIKKHHELCPLGYGFCGITALDLRTCASFGSELDIEHTPIALPDLDPFLKIPNPAHANATRKLTRPEAERAAKLASKRIHKAPPEPNPGVP